VLLIGASLVEAATPRPHRFRFLRKLAAAEVNLAEKFSSIGINESTGYVEAQKRDRDQSQSRYNEPALTGQQFTRPIALRLHPQHQIAEVCDSLSDTR